MADHRNSWEKILPGGAVHASAQDGGPLERLAIIERASTSDYPVPPGYSAWFHRCMTEVLNGTPAAEAFGFVPPRGRSNWTPLNQLINHRRRRAVTLLIPEGAENVNQAVDAVLAVAGGRVAPPSPEAARALAALQQLHDDLPKSKSAIRVIVASVFRE